MLTKDEKEYVLEILLQRSKEKAEWLKKVALLLIFACVVFATGFFAGGGKLPDWTLPPLPVPPIKKTIYDELPPIVKPPVTEEAQ
jgi:4-amino-4-deoxy-L-arabinose transferase-like glycosyltransferase